MASGAIRHFELKRLVWFTALYSGTAALLKLTGFLLFLWFARTLAVDDYATFGLLYAVQAGVMTFSQAGIVEAVIGLLREHRAVRERLALYGTANRLFVLMAIVASGLAVFAFAIVARQSRVSFLALAWVVASGMLLGFSSLQAQLVRLDERQGASLLFSFVAPLAGLGGGFLTFFLDRRAESFFMGSALGVAAALLGLWRSSEGFVRIVEPGITIRAVVLPGLPFMVVAWLGWLGGYGNNYIIHLIFESGEVARFTFALSLAAIMLLVATASNQVWGPRFYRSTHEEAFETVERRNRFFFGTQAVVLGAVAGVVVAVFPATMRAIGGNLVAYQSMALELTLLLGSYVLLSPGWHCQNYFFAYGRGPELMRIMVATSVIGIAVWITLMLAFGPIGVYLGFLTQMLLQTLGTVLGAKKHWPVRVSWEGVAVGLFLTLAGFLVTAF